jgi:hypothetical protein
MLLYWYRLENLGKEFPLSKEAYNETKLLYLSTKPTWYESINIIVVFFHFVINNDLKKILTLFLNFPSVFFLIEED